MLRLARMLPFEHVRKGLYLGGLAAAQNRGIRWKNTREVSFPTPPLLGAGPLGACPGGLFAIGALLTHAASSSVFDGLTCPQPKENGDGDAEQKGLFEGGVFHSERKLMLSFVNFFVGPWFLWPPFILAARAERLHGPSESFEAPHTVKPYCLLAGIAYHLPEHPCGLAGPVAEA